MRRKIEITPGFTLILTGIAVLSGVDTMVLTAVAAAVHELGHILAVRLCGARVKALRLTFGGAQMRIEGALGYFGDAVVALAGPAAGGALAAACGLYGRWSGGGVEAISSLGALSAVYSVFNMLPMGPMDGGRALYAVCAGLFGPERAGVVRFCADILCATAMAAGGVYVFIVSRGNPTALVCAGLMIKACCKTAGFGVKSHNRRTCIQRR